MPVKSLHPKLVADLRAHHGIIGRLLGRMKNIDHRQDRTPWIPKEDSYEYGRRVRQMNVSRNYPETELVIKRVHPTTWSPYITAKQTIDRLRALVKGDNQQQAKPKGYELRMPEAYAIGEDLIAMAKTDHPSVEEMIGIGHLDKTDRGGKLLRELKRKHRIDEYDLVKANDEVRARTGIQPANLLVLGYENGKFVFMPLVDLE